MQLKTEYHKGIAIKVVKNILGNNKQVVAAKFIYKTKPYEFKGDTKEAAVARAKKAIDMMLKR